MKHLYLLIGLIFGTSGLLIAQNPHLTIKNLSGFPDVVNQGSQYTLRAYIHNESNVPFTGDVVPNMEINGQNTGLGSATQVSIAPNDSILWEKTNYTFPNGLMNTGYNDIVVWPTTPVPNVGFTQAEKEIFYCLAAAMKMYHRNVSGLEMAMQNPSEKWDLTLSTINLGGSSTQTGQVSFFIQLNHEVEQLLGIYSGQVAPQDSCTIDIYGFSLKKLVDLYWYPMHQEAPHTITILAKETHVDNSMGGPDFEVLGPLAVEESLSTGLSFYPNPVKDALHIELDPSLTHQVKYMRIYDLSGKMILSVQGYQEMLPVSGLATGKYLLEVELTQGKRAGTFMK